MRKDDNSMMVVTGLVVAVGIGIVAERMSSGFGGPEPAAGQPADDRFMVRAGVATDLDVLSNDGRLQGPLVITQGPTCGVATAVDGAIRYDGSDACSGAISFSYCVGDDQDCAPATVHLALQEAVAPKPQAPVATAAAPVDQKLDLQPLPRGPVVKGGPEFALIPTDRIEDAGLRVFVATLSQPAEMRPVSVVAKYALDGGTPDLRADPVAFGDQAGLVLTGHAVDPLRTAGFLRSYAAGGEDDAPQVSVLDKLKLAALPTEGGFDAVLPAQRVIPTEPVAEASADTAQEIEQVAARFDTDVPDGGACDVAATLTPAPGAHLTLSLSAPCLAGRMVVARSAGLDFLLSVSEEGSLVADLPALALDATVTLDLGSDQAPVTLVADGSGVLQVERSVFRLRSDLGVAVTAFETDKDGASQPVTSAMDIAHRDAFLTGRGYMRRYASTDGRLIEVYTLPLSRQVVAQSVQMALQRSGPGICNGPMTLEFMQLHEQGASLASTKLPATACLAQSGFGLQSVIAPIRVASQ